jgi:hypothetical protein
VQYRKTEDGSAIDDGWRVETANGYTVAYVETESLADAILTHLVSEDGPFEIDELYGEEDEDEEDEDEQDQEDED